MADLDSFFAKKDKKKVKGKKYTTSDEIARRLEDTEKKDQIQVLKTKIEPLRKVEETSEDSPPVVEEPPPKTFLQEEEEWNDFKDENDRDLTNLKINKLQIEDGEDGGGESGDEDGEKGEHGDKRDGVWKTEKAQQAPAAPVVNTIEVEDKSRGSVINSSYVPPHMRNASPMPKSTPRRNRTAPDINNEMSFPSLSDAQASNPMGAWGKKRFNNEGFENVRHGSTRVMADDHSAPKLSTANRFDALSDNS